MKKLKYYLFAIAAFTIISCTENDVKPKDGGENDPIGIPPPPPPPPPPDDH